MFTRPPVKHGGGSNWETSQDGGEDERSDLLDEDLLQGARHLSSHRSSFSRTNDPEPTAEGFSHCHYGVLCVTKWKMESSAG